MHSDTGEKANVGDEGTERGSRIVWGRAGETVRSVVVELASLHISQKEQSLPSEQGDVVQRVHRRAVALGQ